MTNEQNRELCLKLIHAETEDGIIAILKDADHWDRLERRRYQSTH